MNRLTLGIIAPKNTINEILWIGSNINAYAEPYKRGKRYDVIFFFNITNEVEFVKRHTDSKIFAVAIDSYEILKQNKDPRFIDLCDFYMGYKNFCTTAFKGQFQKLIFPAATANDIEVNFDKNIKSERKYTFSIFAKHDPNIRKEIGQAIKTKNGILVGPLFDNFVNNKVEFQIQSKFEFITENVINDYYFSEKLGQSLLAGCVPIYYGCKRIKEYVPEYFFLDFRDFANIEEVINFCNNDDIYEHYFKNIKQEAKNFLLSNSTWDNNVFKPLNEYINKLQKEGFKCHNQSLIWKIERPKQFIKLILNRAKKKLKKCPTFKTITLYTNK